MRTPSLTLPDPFFSMSLGRGQAQFEFHLHLTLTGSKSSYIYYELLPVVMQQYESLPIIKLVDITRIIHLLADANNPIC